MSWVSVAVAGFGVYQTVKSNKDKKKAEADFKAAQASQPDYQTPQSQKDLLADTIANRNAVNPALMMAYRQAQQGAANQQANAQRNATSGAQALAVGNAAQGNLQAIIPSLAKEQTDYSTYGQEQYYKALNSTTDDDRIKFQTRLAKSHDLMNMYLGMIGAANAGKQAGIQNAAGGLMQAGAAYKGGSMARKQTNVPTLQPANYGGLSNGMVDPNLRTQNPSYYMQYPDAYNTGGWT